MRIGTTTLVVALSAALGLVGCGKKDDGTEKETPATAPPGGGAKAPEGPPLPSGPGPLVAVLQAAPGKTVTGTVELTQKDDTVSVVARIEGLEPGFHGFHIHETGDCSDPAFATAGGHFNPATKDHGRPDAPVHHAGDLGNLTAGADGKAEKVITSTDVTLGPGDNSVAGRAVIIHTAQDDFHTQPTGNSGELVACGVIKAR